MLYTSTKSITRLTNRCCKLTLRSYTASVQELSSDTNAVTENIGHQRTLRLAVIGVPNAGKSTLINNLMERQVCAASPKVHTTRVRARAFLNEGNSQIVFIDTPGIVDEKERNRYKLEKSFVLDKQGSLREADMIGVIHDTSNSYTRDRLDIKIIHVLEQNKDIPSFLILNKIDAMKSKRKLLDITRLITENRLRGKMIKATSNLKIPEGEMRGWPYFQEVFMVSALKGSGVSELKEYLIRNCKTNKWVYPEEAWTDQEPESIIVQSVKAVLLKNLPQEVPYLLKPQIEFFEVNDTGVITTVVLVYCPSEKYERLVAGVSDGRLKKMTEEVQMNLQNAFRNFVRIQIVLKS